MTAFGEEIPADCRTAGRDPSPYRTGKPSFLDACSGDHERTSGHDLPTGGQSDEKGNRVGEYCPPYLCSCAVHKIRLGSKDREAKKTPGL